MENYHGLPAGWPHSAGVDSRELQTKVKIRCSPELLDAVVTND